MTTIKFKAGDRLDKFIILKQISTDANAGMSYVYLALDPVQGGKVALKVAKESQTRSKELALQREIEHLQRLVHPNIIKLVEPCLYKDYKEGEIFLFIALEYLAEGSLKDRLDRAKTVPLAETVTIIDQVSQALDYAYRRHGIRHLDLKPANILLDAGGRVVLSDFGIARDKIDVHRLKRQRIGTWLYMAPEQLDSGVIIDHKADIYALGLVLYEMLAGQHPLWAASLSEGSDGPSTRDRIERMIREGRVPRPHDLKPRPNIPQPIEDIIFKAIAKNPNDRYESASALARALKQEVQKLAIARQKRLLYSLAALIILLMMVGIGLVWTSLSTSPPDTNPPPAIQSPTSPESSTRVFHKAMAL